jgi:hypothetical protein
MEDLINPLLMVMRLVVAGILQVANRLDQKAIHSFGISYN